MLEKASRQFTTARLYDPAILPWSEVRYTGTRLMQWARDSRDPAQLVLRPGAKPVLFTCLRLTRDRFSWVEGATTDVEACLRAFQVGVIEVQRPNGEVWRPAAVVKPGNFTGLTDDELDLFEACDHVEIGGVILERSRVPFDYAPRYTVRRSSVDVLEAVLRHLFAEQSQGSAAQSSSGPEGVSG
jgi:hypothetical protein